jgi:hypothetical protein
VINRAKFHEDRRKRLNFAGSKFACLCRRAESFLTLHGAACDYYLCGVTLSNDSVICIKFSHIQQMDNTCNYSKQREKYHRLSPLCTFALSKLTLTYLREMILIVDDCERMRSVVSLGVDRIHC